MFDIIIAIIFGIIQGLTEFLPISSSGHLVILHNFFNLPVKNKLAFDVFLHLATLLAVIFYFRQDIVRITISWLKSLWGEKSLDSRLGWLIILATIPAAIVGYLFEGIIEKNLRDNYIVVAMLILIALLIILIEKFAKRYKDINALNTKNALLIGLAQALAFIPGTSRSGITIIAGMASGLKREVAVRFSFLLSIPIILGASIKKIPPMLGSEISGNEWIIIIFAFAFAFISGFFAIKYLLQYTRNHSLNIFAYYRLVLAGLLLIYLFNA